MWGIAEDKVDENVTFMSPNRTSYVRFDNQTIVCNSYRTKDVHQGAGSNFGKPLMVVGYQ